jgi:undecaprenyl-diphosphatase
MLMPHFQVKIDRMFQRMNHTEIPVVAKVMTLSQPLPLRTLSKVTNFLGDGWIYLPLVLFLLLEKQWRLLAATGLAAAVCFVLYFPAKFGLARVRPCHQAGIVASAQPHCLDQYSFPSGHCMTMTLFGVLLSWGHPSAIPFLLGAVALLAWARVADAYHYPSDLIAGIGLGLTVSVPVARILL